MDIRNLIEKSLSGNANEAEKKKIEDWVNSSHSNKIEFDDITLLWNHCILTDERASSPHDTFQKIRMAVHRPHQGNALNPYLKWVMIILLLVGLPLFFIFYTHYFLQTEEVYLKFDKTPLKEVVAVLEKEYNLKIEIENDEMLTCRFTGTFYQEHSNDSIIQTLSKAMGFEYALLDVGQFRLKGKGC